MVDEHRKPSKRVRSSSRAHEPREKSVTSDESPLVQMRHNLAELIRVVALRRWAFFVPFCVVATLAAIISHQIPRKYKVTTFFERQDNPVLTSLPERASLQFVEDSRPTVYRELHSVELMEKTVENLGLVDAPPQEADDDARKAYEAQRRAEASRYSNGVSVDYRLFDRGPRVVSITLSCEGRDPANLAKVCNGLRDAYIQKARAKMTQKLLDIKGYFEEQFAACRKQIDELNKVRLQDEIDYWLVNPAEPGAIQNRIAALQGELDEILREQKDQQLQLDGHRELAERSYVLAEQSVAANAGLSIDNMNAQVSPEGLRLRQQIEDVDHQIYTERKENRKTDKHPDVQRLYRKRARAVQRLAQLNRHGSGVVAVNRSLNGNTPSARGPVDVKANAIWIAQITRAELEIKTLTTRIERSRHLAKAKAATIAELESQKTEVFKRYQARQHVSEALTGLQDDYGHHRGVIRQLDTLLTADENERAVGFDVVAAARPAHAPIYPLASMTLGLCLLIGAVAGVCVVLLAEIFDHSYHTTKQVARALGLAVLESIDDIVTATDRARLFRRRVFVVPVVVFCLLATVVTSNGLAYLSLQRPSSYHRLLAMPQKAWHRIVGPGEDAVDTVAANSESDIAEEQHAQAR